jgi:hypothetical protein
VEKRIATQAQHTLEPKGLQQMEQRGEDTLLLVAYTCSGTWPCIDCGLRGKKEP